MTLLTPSLLRVLMSIKALAHLYAMEAYVYLITCTVLGKKYVGSTTTTVHNRLQGHLRDSRLGKSMHLPMYVDMRAHGPEAFTIELLETVPKGTHKQREQHWINELRTCEDGYNTRWAVTKQPFKDYHREWSARPHVCECGQSMKWGYKTKHERTERHARQLRERASTNQQE